MGEKMLLEAILALGEDTFIYGELLRGIEATGKKLSETQRNKICAVFAETCNIVPILKFDSDVVWDKGVFGALAAVVSRRKEPLFTKTIPINEFLSNVTPNNCWPFEYKLEELSDPILFKEFQEIIVRLEPGEISWLATHRTFNHTQLCVLKDYQLWQLHMNRIFERLLYSNNSLNGKKNSEISFFDPEIDQAAKDIKQVLSKIRKRDMFRYSLREKLMILAADYPVAANIVRSIGEPRTINPQLLLKNEARRTLTSILRLYLCTLGLAKDRRKMKTRTIGEYVLHLEMQFRHLPIRRGNLFEGLRKATTKHDLSEIPSKAFAIFQILAEPDGNDLWAPKSGTLEQWI